MSLGLENRKLVNIYWLMVLRKMWLAFGIPVYLRHPRAQLLFCWLGNGTAGFWTVGWDGRFAFGVDLSDRDLESLEGRFRRPKPLSMLGRFLGGALCFHHVGLRERIG